MNLDTLVAQLPADAMAYYIEGIRRLTEQAKLIREKNPQMWPFLADPKPKVFCFAGNRSGKTQGIGTWVAGRFTGFDPFRAELVPQPQIGWFIAITREANRYDHLPMICERLPPDSFDVDWADLVIKNRFTGSRIHFKSYEERPETFQAAGIDWAAFDDEPKEKIYREVSMRATGGKRLMLRGTITPINGLTWCHKKIYQAWQQGKQADSLAVYSARTDQNGFLLPEQLAEFEESLEDWEKAIRLRGEFIPLGGRPVFAVVRLLALRDQARPPLRARLVDREGLVRIEEDAQGPLRIWEKPNPCCSYVIGADTAEGVSGGDFSCAQMLRRPCPTHGDTLQHVASYHSQEPPEIFGVSLKALGHYYRTAPIIPEINGPGLLTLYKLTEFPSYPALYCRERFDAGIKQNVEAYGFRTTEATRPMLVGSLAAAIRDQSFVTQDLDTLDECGTFVKTDGGKDEAQAGCHDDRVLASALAVIGHRAMPLPKPPVPESPKTESASVIDEALIGEGEGW